MLLAQMFAIFVASARAGAEASQNESLFAIVRRSTMPLGHFV